MLVVVSDCSITKFLNRILGLEVYKQNSLFQYFTDNFDYLIEKDKKEGKYDLGILGMMPATPPALQALPVTAHTRWHPVLPANYFFFFWTIIS